MLSARTPYYMLLPWDSHVSRMGTQKLKEQYHGKKKDDLRQGGCSDYRYIVDAVVSRLRKIWSIFSLSFESR